MSEEKQMSRRDFTGLAVWAIGGLITAGLGIPALSYIIGPALQRSGAHTQIWLGAAPKGALGIPTLFHAKLHGKSGWARH